MGLPVAAIMTTANVRLRSSIRGRRSTIRAGCVLTTGCVGLASMGFVILVKPMPCIVYNATASAPIGYYVVLPAFPLHRGDLVLVNPPYAARHLAAERNYLPTGVPLVKRIAAMGGELVCAGADGVSIRGVVVAHALVADTRGRRLPAWSGCGALGPDEVFLLTADIPTSFDSRYFGPVPAGSVIGRLAPL
jgi:conjugative transfer signal peptidase TraF